MNRYHTFNKRLFAHMVDSLVMLPFIGLGFLTSQLNNLWINVGVEALYLIIWTAYLVIGHARWGQTLGKRLVQIKVVDVADENRLLSYSKAFYREAVPFIVGVAALVLFVTDAYTTGETDPYGHETGRISRLVISVWMLIEFITLFFNAKRRAIHDFLAGSVVVDLAEVRRNQFKQKQEDLLRSLRNA